MLMATEPDDLLDLLHEIRSTGMNRTVSGRERDTRDE
jgi:hypothetical protein